jgi:hypothetical protein
MSDLGSKSHLLSSPRSDRAAASDETLTKHIMEGKIRK